MKRKLLSLLLSLAMLLPCLPAASAAEEKPDFAGDDGIIKVLAIGNSFTKDSFYFFDDVEGAQDPDDNLKMVVGYLYQGGVPVQTHADNAVNDKADYIYYKYDRTVSKSWTEVQSTTRNALLDEDWDLISIQLTPTLSSAAEPEAGLETLVDFLRTNATNPKMKLGRHFTWAYGGVYRYTGPYKDKFINAFNSSTDTMYQSIAQFSKDFEQTHPEFEFIVPSGTVIQNLRAGAFGDNLQRDAYHLNSFGRGMVAYTWYTFLSGKPLDSIKLSKTYWKPTEYERTAIMEAINGAFANPYQVTPATGTEPAPRRVYFTLEPLAKEGGGEVKAYDVSSPTEVVTVQYTGHTGGTIHENMFYILQEDGVLSGQTIFNWVPNVGYHNYYQGYDDSNTVILANGTATMGGHVGSSSCGFICTSGTSSGGRELPYYILNAPTTTPVVDVTGEDHGLKTLQDIIDLSATHRIRLNHYSQYNSAPAALFVDEVVPVAVSNYTLQDGDVVFIPGTATIGTTCDAYIMNSATAERGEKVSLTIPNNAPKATGKRNNTIGRFWEMKDGQLKIIHGIWYSHKNQGDPSLTSYHFGYHDEVVNYSTGVLTLAQHPRHLGGKAKCAWSFPQACGADDSRGLGCSAELKRTSDLKIIDLRATVLASKEAPLSTVSDIYTQCTKHDDIMVNTYVPDGTKTDGTAAVMIVLDSSGFFTRGEVVQALYEKSGQPKVTAESTFTDVPVENVHYNAIRWAADKGYISGYGDGTFGPNDHVTMEQMAVILWKYMGQPEDDVSLSQLGQFSPWATNALHWAVAKNVFEIIPYTTLGDNAPRTETVQMLTNYLK